jgi:preprotein translocase SecE subunit
VAKKTNDANVTRITASDSGSSKRVKSNATNETKVSAKVKSRSKPAASPKGQSSTDGSSSRGPLKAILDYFTGAWYELRQVRWPTRGATWGLTGAVLIFSAFFIVFILLVDAGFKYIFEQLLK